MRKIFAAAILFCGIGSVIALPVDNGATAALYSRGVCLGRNPCLEPCGSCWDLFRLLSLRVGFYGDYVYNRDLQLVNAPYFKDIQTTEIFTNAGYLALNFCRWIDLFVTFGATNFAVESAGTSFFVPVMGFAYGLATLNFDPAFSWSVGGRAIAWQCGNFFLGIEGQYFKSQPKFTHFLYGNEGNLLYVNPKLLTSYKEWQVGLAAAYRVESCEGFAFIPYTGVKWAGGLWDFNHYMESILNLRNMEPSKLWGYVVGLTATTCEVVGITVEGRFADEKAVYVNGQFRF